VRDVSNVELNRFALHLKPRFGFSSRMQRGLLHPLRKMSNFFCTCCGVNKQDNKLVSWMRASQSGMTMGSVYGTNIRWTVPKSHSAAPRPGDMHLKRARESCRRVGGASSPVSYSPQLSVLG